jgi:hypothetical protein
MAMKKLPVGIQSFESLRTDGYLYVDKTEHIYRIVTEGKVYFLSRPRRFGKSLLISTMDALFSGKKELFKDLWIEDKWDWTRQNPVIRIDWTAIKHKTSEEIERSAMSHLRRMAVMRGLSLVSEYASDCFGELIQLLHQKTGRTVVVLIDEYDSPILDTMGKPEMKEIQEFLQEFYK